MNKERSVNVRRHATRAAGGDGRGCSLDTVKEWISSIVSDGVVTVRWLMPAARSGAATDGSHCNKYPYIHRYFVANFPHCNVGPGFTNPSTYGYKRIRNRGSVKVCKNSPQNTSGYTDIFYSAVQHQDRGENAADNVTKPIHHAILRRRRRHVTETQLLQPYVASSGLQSQ